MRLEDPSGSSVQSGTWPDHVISLQSLFFKSLPSGPTTVHSADSVISRLQFGELRLSACTSKTKAYRDGMGSLSFVGIVYLEEERSWQNERYQGVAMCVPSGGWECEAVP